MSIAFEKSFKSTIVVIAESGLRLKQTDLISGFSEIKDILVRVHQIDRPRNQIRLFFSRAEDALYVHDYADHKKRIMLVESIASKDLLPFKETKALLLIRKALSNHDPVNFLNEAFLLNGFFLS